MSEIQKLIDSLNQPLDPRYKSGDEGAKAIAAHIDRMMKDLKTGAQSKKLRAALEDPDQAPRTMDDVLLGILFYTLSIANICHETVKDLPEPGLRDEVGQASTAAYTEMLLAAVQEEVLKALNQPE